VVQQTRSLDFSNPWNLCSELVARFSKIGCRGIILGSDTYGCLFSYLCTGSLKACEMVRSCQESFVERKKTCTSAGLLGSFRRNLFRRDLFRRDYYGAIFDKIAILILRQLRLLLPLPLQPQPLHRRLLARFGQSEQPPFPGRVPPRHPRVVRRDG